MSEKKDTLLKVGCEVAKEAMLTKGELMSQFCIVTETGETAIVPSPWGNEGEKVIMLQALKLLFARLAVVEYCFISEIWLRRVSTEKEMELHRRIGKLIEAYDDKQEGVMVLYVGHHEENVMVHLETIRDEKGKVIELRRREDELKGIGGRMANLLPERNAG